jgi:hypothetical protein
VTERYRERLAGVLSCYDRIIVTGTLPGACYAQGMTAFLSARQIRIFDYPRFAEPLRDRVRVRAAELARSAGVTIEHVAKRAVRCKSHTNAPRTWARGWVTLPAHLQAIDIGGTSAREAGGGGG